MTILNSLNPVLCFSYHQSLVLIRRPLQADAEKEPVDVAAAAKDEDDSEESDDEVGEITGGLLPQDLSKLKVDELTPLTPEVISRQVCYLSVFLRRS